MAAGYGCSGPSPYGLCHLAASRHRRAFSATNERQGSQIAREVIHAFLDCDIKILIVTHLYDLAHGLHQRHNEDAVFLRAQRTDEGTRIFRLQPGEPLPTGYGTDLYQQILGRR